MPQCPVMHHSTPNLEAHADGDESSSGLRQMLVDGDQAYCTNRRDGSISRWRRPGDRATPDRLSTWSQCGVWYTFGNTIQ